MPATPVPTPDIITNTSENVSVKLLKPHPKNPRRGVVPVIVESLQQHGQYRPLVVQRSTGYVIGGNHTLKAAIHLKMKEVAVSYLDVDDAEALRILLIDNRASDLGTYDDEKLLDLLQSTSNDYGDLLGTGYDQPALDDLAALLEERDAAGPGTEIEGIRYESSLGERAAAYADKAQRILILTLPNPIFEWINETLALIGANRGTPSATNTELILSLVAEAAGETPPSLPYQ